MLKANTEKRNLKYKGTNITMTTDFSSETMKARKQWGHILKVLKGKNLLTYHSITSENVFHNKGGIKPFSDI